MNTAINAQIQARSLSFSCKINLLKDKVANGSCHPVAFHEFL